MFKKLESLKSSIPQITVFIILLGLFKQLLYYANFNLPIKYFIGLSELGLIISDDLMIYVPLIFIFLFLIRMALTSKIEKDKRELFEKGFLRFNPKHSKGFEMFVRFLFMIATVVVIILYFNIRPYPYKIILANTLLFTLTGIYMSFATKDFINSIPDISSFFVFIFFLTIISSILLKVSYEIVAVEKGKFKGTIVATQDSTYISNKTNYFIGKTEKYVFIYNANDTTTSVIPTESITKFIIKQK